MADVNTNTATQTQEQGNGTQTNTTANANTTGAGADTTPKVKTEEEIRAELQKEYEKMADKRVTDAIKKKEKEWADKQAKEKMTEDERRQAEEQERLQAQAKRDLDLTIKGLKLDVVDAVQEMGLDAGFRNLIAVEDLATIADEDERKAKPWKPMDIPKFVYDCKNVGTMIINKERHDFESKQTIKLPKEEWVYVENALPPIVTQEEWDLICKIHEERVIATGSDKRGKKTSGYSFSGKLVCGICGAPYWRKQRVSKDEYWVCSTKQTKGRKTRKRDSTMGKAGEINPLGCDNENISYNSLMEIMGVVSERLQANTDTIKQDMINWLTKLRKQLLEANGGHTEADLQRELSRKSKLLDAYLDGILNKQEYQKKAEELDERIIQLKAETEKNKANSGDIAEIDKVLANIDEEVSRYVDGNEKLKVEYLLEHLEQVQIFPDKVIVIVPILSEGIVIEKTQYVSREKRRRENNNNPYASIDYRAILRNAHDEWCRCS